MTPRRHGQAFQPGDSEWNGIVGIKGLLEGLMPPRQGWCRHSMESFVVQSFDKPLTRLRNLHMLPCMVTLPNGQGAPWKLRLLDMEG
jgi:hypothetical protein